MNFTGKPSSGGAIDADVARPSVGRSIPARKTRILLLALAVLTVYYFSLPQDLFTDPYSTVLQDRRGELLSASIAADGQWRFPRQATVPANFSQALLTYEDKRFYHHPGVDPLAMIRAVRQDVAARAVVSGGSTLSMQVIRMSRKEKSRTIWEKCIEVILATRLEWRYSKEEILALYAGHAPFGGNVVGIDAACWRYFGRPSNEISWGEAALLAVLPNSPGLMHPGKNRDKLKQKRDRLLTRLEAAGVIDEETRRLSTEEAIPEAPRPLPRWAHHLLVRAEKDGHRGTVVTTTVDHDLQMQIESIVKDHHVRLRSGHIENLAALVLDVETGEVLSYVGNVPGGARTHESEVDVIMAPRSTGSIMKPFLYAAMLDEGRLLPHTLLPDVPTMINGFVPRNFTRQYDGAVHADDALVRSLNVPAVHLLREYRYEKFYNLLRDMGMRTLTKPPDHYGLSLILGGAEGSLWDVTSMYASMARTLNHYHDRAGSLRYDRADFHAATYRVDAASGDVSAPSLDVMSWLSAPAIYQTFEVLTQLSRPGEESGWRHFSSSRKIAWKTGTSFGFRDGWAIGVTPSHVVGVWVGNADGEGRPGLTGTDAAAPLMFDIFGRLNGRTWFQAPRAGMTSTPVCTQSGQRKTELCPSTYNAWVVPAALSSTPCTYHRRVHLTHDHRYRIHRSCAGEAEMEAAAWFVLPPLEEHFYRSRHISYKPLPPFRPGCEQNESLNTMSLIYPKPNAQVMIPRELDGSKGRVVFELAHRNPEITVHWHVDGSYIGSTRAKHFQPLFVSPGRHTVTLVDENGTSLQVGFEALSAL